jgi:NAD(P)-dependent dehydrogenase (short-subunit alcohol dehydrogenase family)
VQKQGRFEGQVAFITGGGGGIGKATALRLCAEGATVVVADFVKELADKAAEEVKAKGGTALAITLDVGVEQDVISACDDVIKKYGRLDVMVCGAGARSSGAFPVVEFSAEEWAKVLAVNLMGAFFPAQAAAKHMVKAGKGSIVTISSINAIRAVPGAVAYNAAKAGVISMTQTFAVELARRGVRVNTVAPAQIETPLTAGHIGEKRTTREEGIPMGRFGKAEEVASAIAFLASDDASFITGHTLLVDGGRMVMQHKAGFPLAT